MQVGRSRPGCAPQSRRRAVSGPALFFSRCFDRHAILRTGYGPAMSRPHGRHEDTRRPETLAGLAAMATRRRLRRQQIHIGGKKGFGEPSREPLAHNFPKASASIRACRPYLSPWTCSACRRNRAGAVRPSVDAPSPSSGWRCGPIARAPRGVASRPCTS